MAWQGSTRRQRLPKDWPQRRLMVLERDRWACQIRDPQRCIGRATEVDHKRAGDDHSLANLQAACDPCHKHKTATERPRTTRSDETHPGLL